MGKIQSDLVIVILSHSLKTNKITAKFVQFLLICIPKVFKRTYFSVYFLFQFSFFKYINYLKGIRYCCDIVNPYERCTV